MRLEDAPEIRRLSLFATMAEPAFEALVRGAYLQTFPPQVQLMAEGDTPDFLHVLIEGSVEMYATWNRRETTMAILRPVTTFIPAAAITDRANLMSARTLAKSRIALIPAEDIRRAFRDDPQFAVAMAGELAIHFRSATKHVKELKLRSSIERLAACLLRLDAEAGGTGRFSLPYEKRQLAAYLGMTPESLSRALASLRAYGVSVDQAEIVLTNVDDLHRLARPTPLIDEAEPPVQVAYPRAGPGAG